MKPSQSIGEINPAATVDVELEHFTPEHLASKRYGSFQLLYKFQNLIMFPIEALLKT